MDANIYTPLKLILGSFNLLSSFEWIKRAKIIKHITVLILVKIILHLGFLCFHSSATNLKIRFNLPVLCLLYVHISIYTGYGIVECKRVVVFQWESWTERKNRCVLNPYLI